jgi:cytochrome c-type biogenesis protein CcsB
VSTQDFAQLSDRAIMFASFVYALALLAHVAEWARSMSRPAAVRREPAMAGAPAEPTPAGPSTGPSTGPSAEALERWELKIESAGRIGVALTIVGALLHLVGVVARSLATDPVRVPWGNMYEFTVTGTLVVVVAYLVLMRRLDLRWMGLFLTAFTVVTLMCANLLLVQEAGPLVPALHSYWLVIHVGAAMVASGAFALGALASVVFLLKARAETRPGSALDRLSRVFPAGDALDRFAYRVHAVGFPLWTFAVLIAGPIWAEYAWGSYWNWDPKEVWAFITWVCYAAYLHARATAGWKGRAAAMLALIGFASLMFNFIGINFFFGGGSMHSYAG